MSYIFQTSTDVPLTKENIAKAQHMISLMSRGMVGFIIPVKGTVVLPMERINDSKQASEIAAAEWRDANILT